MDRHPLAIAMIAFLLLPCGLAQETTSQKQATSPFRSIVKPQGWEIPKHGRVKSRKLFVAADHEPTLAAVHVSDFGSSQPMFLPWYYMEHERLMLYSFEFRIANLLMFDVDGKPFRYVAAAIGSHIGASATASWTDRDGDGTFEEFRWASTAMEDLPQWVVIANEASKTKTER